MSLPARCLPPRDWCSQPREILPRKGVPSNQRAFNIPAGMIKVLPDAL